MHILHILTQKPNSTGSGVYLTELVRVFQQLGHEQAVVAGMDINDSTAYLPGVRFYPVTFNTPALPFNVVGMSDTMPYASTRYNQLTEEMAAQLERAFISVLQPLIADFQPDIIICHHLYFLTSIVREYFPGEKVLGICHGTDLRQLKKTSLAQERIKENIRKLDFIFALHNQQKKEIQDLFHIESDKIKVIGAGYNDGVFYDKHYEKPAEPVKLIYAGKIAYKKGVASLIKSLATATPRKDFELYLAGGYSNLQEYREIAALAKKAPYKLVFLGKLPQQTLADYYNQCHIMVLPSFFEGLPLVIIEALACGLNVVATDLPGVQHWLNASIPQHHVSFVSPPQMLNVDDPVAEEIPLFESNLSHKLTNAIDNYTKNTVDLSQVSWTQVAQNILHAFRRSICQ